MKLLNIPFEIVVSNYDEEKDVFISPTHMVEELSFKKATTVGKKHKDAIIIGADTTVVLKGEVIGKPKDKKDAIKMLKKLSGTTHEVITGFTLLDSKTGKRITSSVTSQVKLLSLRDDEITAYLNTAEYKDKAGGYAVQELGGIFVDEVHGDFFNIVGLPIKNIRHHLKEFGVKTLE